MKKDSDTVRVSRQKEFLFVINSKSFGEDDELDASLVQTSNGFRMNKEEEETLRERLISELNEFGC